MNEMPCIRLGSLAELEGVQQFKECSGTGVVVVEVGAEIVAYAQHTDGAISCIESRPLGCGRLLVD